MITPTKITYKNCEYLRIPIKTKILSAKDDFVKIIKKSASEDLRKGDIISISESPLAITQGRAIPEDQIEVGFLANLLWRFVQNNPHGVGLRSPTSMQCAIDEVGTVRILFAALAAGFSKLVGRKGDFYRIAGKQAALIDAANTSPVPPYTSTVIKGPLKPDKVAQTIKNEFGFETAIMDINDIGGSWMIGGSDNIAKELVENVMKDNPQGQGDELTPLCIIRKIR